MKQNKDVLDEISKGCAMGMDAITDIKEYVTDKKFKDNLEIEYDKYDKIHKRVEECYVTYSDEDTPTETNKMNKVMTKSMIDMKMLKDKSDSKIAELLLQGTNMGIIEGVKLINNKNGLDKEVEDILNDFIKMQEDSVEFLKEYL